jgi:hypothetical protein
VSLQVQDDEGRWSARVYRNVYVTNEILAEAEYNDAPGSANPVPLNTWITGEIMPGNNVDYFKIHLEHYTEQLDMGAQTLQRDEAQMALASGYDFSQPAVEAFRDHLTRHFPEEQLNEWGIRNPDAFDVRAYFIGLGVPNDPHPRWFHGWQRDDPIKQAYDRFILEAVVGFYQRLRAALNHHAGRTVPFSCNNTSNQVWTPVHRQFDWAMSELMFRTANPQHLYDRFREGLGYGKVQVLSTPKPLGSVEDHDAFRELNRKVIALAYALGGLCKTPWDLFLQTSDGKGRYFGKAADYADLYGFVRGLAPYLEGFEEAAAYGNGIPDVHGWNTLPLRIEGNDEACAFLRVRPRDPESPVVIHLVNWSDERVGLDLLLHKPALAWDSSERVVRALSPAPYDARLHALAERKQALLRKGGELRGPDQYPAYQHLIDSVVLEPADEGGWIRLSGLSAAPWTTIVIDKIAMP